MDEISCDGDSGVGFECGDVASPIGMESSPSSTLHEGIFSPPPYPLHQSTYEIQGALNASALAVDQKILQVSAGRNIVSLQAYRSHSDQSGGKVEVGGEVKWGGPKDEVSYSFGGSAECHDGKGNYVEGDYYKSSDGSSRASGRVGHREKERDQNRDRD